MITQTKATEKPFHVELFILLSQSCSAVVENLVLFSNVFVLIVLDLVFFFADGEEWYKLRSVLSKRMLRPKEAADYTPDFNKINSDFIHR